MLRWLVLLVFALGLPAFWLLGGAEWLTWASLAEKFSAFSSHISAQPVESSLLFLSAYAGAVAFSLPGASLLSLLGGALFGVVWGAGLILLGATLGATAIFLAARSTLGETLRAKATGKVVDLQAGFAKNAFSYLLFLRLTPVFPFWLVNIVPALLGMKLEAYVLATFIGIIPGVLVYAGIGNGLRAALARGEVPDLAILAEPIIWLPLLGLGLLSLLPLIIRKARHAKV
jgi:uncharacterized membrane protein YdjX (TVP38/TMEM64 family)